MEDEMASFFSDFFRNSMLKFFDDLFNYVLKESEGIECVPRFDELPMVFPLYQKNVGIAVVRILEMVGPHINEFFVSVGEKMKDRKNVGNFVERLGAKLLLDGKASETLYFLAVTSRVFSLVRKEGKLSLNVYIKECVKALEKTSSGPNALAGFKDILPLVSNILRDIDWRDEFKDLNLGDESYYFTPETAAENI